MITIQRCTTAATGLLLALFFLAGDLHAQEAEQAEQAEAQDSGEAEKEAEAEQQPVAQGPTPKLFMLPTDSLDGAITQLVTDRINESKRSLLGGDRNLELLPSFREIASQSTGSPYANVAEAERIYTSAIGLLNVGNYQRAAELFQRAVDLLEENVSGIQNFGVLSDSLANLALAYFHSGFDLDARQNMQKFAHLVPTATLDPEVFPDELREIYASEVERVEIAEAGILHIESDREGAMIFIDGQLKGEAPLTVEDVGFGYHYLVARTSDREWEEQIRVRGRGQEQNFEVNFEALEADGGGANDLPAFYVDLQKSLRTGRFGLELEPYLLEVSNQTGADFIGWVIVVRERSEYLATPFVYRSDDGMVVRGEAVSFNLELSNLRSRINRLTAIISMAVSDMPEALAVVEVDMAGERAVEEEEEQGLAVVAGEDPGALEQDHEEGLAQADEAETGRARLPVPATSPPAGVIADPGFAEEGVWEKNRWRILGWSGAALVTGGAIAGTIYFLARGAAEPGSFEAEVQW